MNSRAPERTPPAQAFSFPQRKFPVIPMNKDAPYVVSGIVRRLFVGLLYSFYDHARLLCILLIMNYLP